MLILDGGVVAVYTEHGKELEHLIDGDHFDVLSLFSDQYFDGNTLIAVTNTQVRVNNLYT